MQHSYCTSSFILILDIFWTFVSKVDVIVSEWMGYFLLRESMLDSVVVARWANDTFYLHVPNVFMLHASILRRTSNTSFEQCKVDIASKNVFVLIPFFFFVVTYSFLYSNSGFTGYHGDALRYLQQRHVLFC